MYFSKKTKKSKFVDIFMQRYSVITEKNPREIVLLRGRGCRYRKCTFCDYHEDLSCNIQENLTINKNVLSQVTGIYNRLEVVNSGSFCELDNDTINAIRTTCIERNIFTVHFECHWLFRKKITDLRDSFAKVGIEVKMKIGVETFDNNYRESIMKKGIKETDPLKIAAYFDECCLLFGLPNQTFESMKNDIEIGLKYFERVCVNIMVENTAPLQPSSEVREIFMKKIYPIYKDNLRIDILLHNTDFGVGCTK